MTDADPRVPYLDARDAIDDALNLLAELDEIRLDEMTDLYYRVGFDSLYIVLRNVPRAIGEDVRD